jgi:universal stress protein E
MSEVELPRRALVALSFTDDPLDPAFGITPGDKNLITQALWYAQQTGAHLTFLHALEGDDLPLPFRDDSLHALLRQSVAPHLEQVAARARHLGVDAAWALAEGDAWECVLQKVKEDDFNLVMTGPRRQDQPLLDQLMHGSTTRRVSRRCPVPVWITCPMDHVDVRRVLVPTDFSAVGQRQVAVADAFAALTGAERVLVHFLQFPGDFAASRAADPEEAVRAYHDEVRAEAMGKARALLGDAFDQWRVSLLEGDLVEVVQSAIREHEVDLVVMGSVARKGLVGMIVGNTAEKLLSQLRAPLWVLKPEGWNPAA